MAERTVRLEERLVAQAQCAVALKEDLQGDLACQSPKVGRDLDSSQEVPVFASDEATQKTQLPLVAQLLQTTSSGATDATSLGSNSDPCLPVLDAILKNQETLQKILMNQDVLKGLVDGLLKAMTNIEERVHSIESQLGLLRRFTEELNAVDSETNWG